MLDDHDEEDHNEGPGFFSALFWALLFMALIYTAGALTLRHYIGAHQTSPSSVARVPEGRP